MMIKEKTEKILSSISIQAAIVLIFLLGCGDNNNNSTCINCGDASIDMGTDGDADADGGC